MTFGCPRVIHTATSLPLASIGGLMLSVFIACFAAACASDTPDAELFVGPVGDSDVVAAILLQGDEAIVYTCGTGDSLETSTAWTRVPVVDGSVEVNRGGTALVASRSDSNTALLGTLMMGDTSQMLDLARVTTSTDAGLFQHVDGTCRTAAIAFRRDGQITVQGARFCDESSPFFQVTPFRPVELLDDSLHVNFLDGAGLRELDLGRVAEF